MEIKFDNSVIDYGRALAFATGSCNVKLLITPLLRNPSKYINNERLQKEELSGNDKELTELENIFYQAVELQIPLCKTEDEKEYLKNLLLNK
ncbi:MAG: hypothetical protein ACK5N8_00415 [Alphaproteobacteria bacterium]